MIKKCDGQIGGKGGWGGGQRDGYVKERIEPSVCGFIWLDGENFICKFTEGFIVCCKQNEQRAKRASKMMKLNNM